MPNWQPNWQDVRWNYGAADAAASALRRIADMLDETASKRADLAREAQAEWRGQFREVFDQELERLLRRAGELAHECREAANRIAQASQRARDEQAHRERERARWWREKREEEEQERRRCEGR
jgi:uncharacterized protein YukE